MASTPKKSPLHSPSKSKLRSQFSPVTAPVTPNSLPARRSTRLNSLLTDSPQTPNLVDAFNESKNQDETPKRGRRIGQCTEPAAKSRLDFDFSRKEKALTRKSASKLKNEKNKKSESDVIPFVLQSPDKPKSVKRKKEKEDEKTVELSKKRNGKDKSVKVLFAPTSPEQSETKKRKRKNVVEKTVVTKGKGAASKGGKIAKVQYYKKVVYDGGEFEVGNDVYVKRIEDGSSDEEDPEVEECKLCFCFGEEIMIECDSCLGGFHLKCLKPPLKDVPEGDWICGICDGRKMGKNVDFPKPPAGKKLARTMRQKLHSSDLWAARIESIWKDVDGSYWCRVRWYMIPEETSVGRQPHNLSRELYRTNDSSNIEEYAKASNEGDDVFLCEYEYDIHWHSFKRLADIDDKREVTNLHKGRFFGLQKIGTKRIPEHIRSHKQTNLERAKASLLLASLPKSLPCRNKEMDEITTFIRGAISDNQCLGRCLYIHGVPGTGKTMSVLSVMRSLRSEVDAGNIKPYCFVEINGLKLATPENIYKVIYEALSGHRVGWKEALRLLNERFVEGKKIEEEADRPCILLIDELDLLVTRNQSVLYNILDWPTKPHSKLIVIGIANTMDLPEKLLPRISSRMGIQRLCFAPYNYQQLQEIISSRLNGIDIFEKQAMEFASRKFSLQIILRVAAISGDARRALEICRRAAEIADYRIKKLASNPDNVAAGKGLVSMADVEAAIQEMFQAPHIQVMKNCSRLSKIFLTAMVHELYKTGMGETTFEKLANTVSCLCTSNGEVFPGYDILLQVGCKLGECRVVLCEAGARHRLQKLQLNFP
ncbi:hypothetical protein RYX36_033507, partial [Vicia faba]